MNRSAAFPMLIVYMFAHVREVRDSTGRALSTIHMKRSCVNVFSLPSRVGVSLVRQ